MENYKKKQNINWILPQTVLVGCYYIIMDTIWQVLSYNSHIQNYLICLFIHIYEKKNIGKIMELLFAPPPPKHTHLGRGLIRLTLHLRTITHGCEIVQWDHSIPKILVISENKPVWIT